MKTKGRRRIRIYNRKWDILTLGIYLTGYYRIIYTNFHYILITRDWYFISISFVRLRNYTLKTKRYDNLSRRGYILACRMIDHDGECEIFPKYFRSRNWKVKMIRMNKLLFRNWHSLWEGNGGNLDTCLSFFSNLCDVSTLNIASIKN